MLASHFAVPVANGSATEELLFNLKDLQIMKTKIFYIVISKHILVYIFASTT